MARSSTRWTINPDAYGLTLDELVTTRLPAWNEIALKFELPFPQPAAYQRTVDDVCPDFDENGHGLLKIYPYSELDKVVQDGDIAVFMEQKVDVDVPLSLTKQRGAHAEVIFHNSAGALVQCAPWEGKSKVLEYSFRELCSHWRYDRSFWNLHIFRISQPDAPDAHISRLLAGVGKWRVLFEDFAFPQGRHILDPSDFKDLDELAEIARRLVRRETVKDVNCMQWVCTVLSLALNFPLNRNTLEELGVVKSYEETWSRSVGYLEEDIVPLGRLPIDPYSPSDLIGAAFELYLGVSEADFQTLWPNLRCSSAFEAVLRDAPPATIPPVAPSIEYRNRGHGGRVQWAYVATAFADDLCRQQ